MKDLHTPIVLRGSASALLALLVGAACGGNQARPAAAATPQGASPGAPAPQAPALPPPPPAPKLRLSRDVVPTRYALDLNVTPSEAGFDGTVDIDVNLAAAATGLWLNAAQIEVKEASITAGGATSVARVLPSPEGDESHLGLAVDRVIGPGAARVHIVYRGKLQTNDTQGVFKQKSGDDWYVFTQFEEIDARRGVPCFDDPSFKTPWSLTLRIPKDHVAGANTAIATETTEGDRKVVRFEESKPLPSYLLAFTVGPFDIVDGGKSKSGVPVRIFAFRGRGADAAYAAESTRQILDTLEAYFGIPYPFGKLDEVPIPKTVAFGAMENAGLVTYVEGSLLVKKANDTLEHRKRYASVCAHELAHQWFGDLVTLAWWNDTWLNESFATWMQGKVLETWQPSWSSDVERARSASRSLDGDTLSTARAVRQPIESENDIANAFDNITYGKGSAVLAMFEAYLGPEVFQKGVRAYLAKHSFGNATAADFFAAISAAAGADVAPMMSSFLDQAGEPVVTTQLSCEGGASRLAIEQRRNLLPGQKGDERLWQIPVCVRYGTAAQKGDGRACTLVSERTASLELPGACPAWVLPNAGALGYYRSILAGDGLAKVIAHKKSMTLSETVGLTGDLSALVKNGSLPAGDVLAVLPALGVAGENHLATESSGLLRQIRRTFLPPELMPALAHYVESVFGARARALGWTPRKGETAEDMELRTALLPLVAVEGNDKALQAEARRLALRWLDDRSSVHPDLALPLLTVTARTLGDQAFLDRLEAAFDRTTDTGDRQRITGAFGSFRDPALFFKAFDFALDEKRDIREGSGVFFQSLRRGGEISSDVYEWVKAHFDRLAERMPRQGRGSLLRTGIALCDEDKLKDYEAFFKDRADKILGGPRIFANTVETIQSCIAIKRAQAPSVARFFSKNRAR